MSKTITRKIHFFRFHIHELSNGSSEFQTHSSQKDVIEKIASLKFMGDHEQSRFYFYPNNDVCFLNDVDVKGDTIEGRFAISRRSSLPELEKDGVLQPLNIPRNSGLAEITHFIYFPNKNVLGVEFNFFGPRANSLSFYLRNKSRNFSHPFEYIELSPILNQDVDALLKDMGEVNLFQMEVARNELEVVKELDEDLYSAFESAANVSDAESVEVILRKKKYSREGFGFPFSKKKIKELLSTGDNRQKVNRMKANAESHSEKESKNFDLLEDKMIVSKKVTALGERSRSIDSKDMFAKIREAYDDLEENF